MELRFENLVKDFSGTIAVNDLSLTVPDGKLTGLLGPSGCGKSTLLYMIAGLEQPTSGKSILTEKTLPMSQRKAVESGWYFRITHCILI